MKNFTLLVFIFSLLPLANVNAFSECNAGYYTVTDNDETRCIPCEAGRYQDEPGQSECKLCEIGRFQKDEGRINCEECPEGFTTLGLGATQCVPVNSALPLMNRWGLLLLGLLVLSTGYFASRKLSILRK
jgi:hypothetical protein